MAAAPAVVALCQAGHGGAEGDRNKPVGWPPQVLPTLCPRGLPNPPLTMPHPPSVTGPWPPYRPLP